MTYLSLMNLLNFQVIHSLKQKILKLEHQLKDKESSYK